MGDRFTQAPQSRELVRARRLRQALERGAPPTFVPPGIPNPIAQPSSLSWYPAQKKPAGRNGAAKNPPATAPEGILDIRRQYLEQLFESSPDPLLVVDT